MSGADAELIARCLDGRADDALLDALASAASRDPALLRQLRQHLAIAEVASQLTAPERSPEAFLDGLRERVRIDADGDRFTGRVLAAAQASRVGVLRAVLAFTADAARVGAAALLLIGVGYAVGQATVPDRVVVVAPAPAPSTASTRIPTPLDARSVASGVAREGE